MFLIVGLGNRGEKYKNTYHNAGFNCVDGFASEIGASIKKNKGNSLIYEGKIKGKRILLAKPLTFMNLSGESVYYLAKKHKINQNNILIIYDDIDTKIGNIRYRNSGSAGGHNGLKNIISIMNTNKIKRIKIGISNNSRINGLLSDHVLSNIKKTDLDNFELGVEKAINTIKEFLDNDGELENKTI